MSLDICKQVRINERVFQFVVINNPRHIGLELTMTFDKKHDFKRRKVFFAVRFLTLGFYVTVRKSPWWQRGVTK